MSSMRWEVVKLVFAVGGNTQSLKNKKWGEMDICSIKLFHFYFSPHRTLNSSRWWMYLMALIMVFQSSRGHSTHMDFGFGEYAVPFVCPSLNMLNFQVRQKNSPCFHMIKGACWGWEWLLGLFCFSLCIHL